jgi:TolB protein
VRFRLHDVVRGTNLGGESFLAGEADLRFAAHRMADWIYEKLTGERGIFATRVLFVAKQGPRYRLNVADWDGENIVSPLTSTEPIMSPAWSPDGTRLAYVSFESRKPVVYVHMLANGQRKAVANFRGSNSAPAWSPDGRTLAVTLTRDGPVAGLPDQPTAAASRAASPRRAASTPSRPTRPTVAASTSRPIAAARRRSTGCRPTAATPRA